LEGDLAEKVGREEPFVTVNLRAAREENRLILEERELRLWAELWARIEES
jgi:hypothetical protein